MLTIYLLTFVLAACSLTYEFMLAQTVSTMAANNVVWYSLAVGVFIGSMGVGAYFSSRFFSRDRIAVRLLKVEVMLCSLGAISVLVLHASHSLGLKLLVSGWEGWAHAQFFSVAFVMSFVIGMLSGAELPLLIDLAAESKGSQASEVSARVLGFDYMGSLAGALVFPILIVPYVNMLSAAWLVAGVNLVAAFLLYLKLCRGQAAPWGLALLAVFIGVGVMFSPVIQQRVLQSFYYFSYPSTAVRSEVRHLLTPYQSVDLVKFGAEESSQLPQIFSVYSDKYRKDPSLPRHTALYLNYGFQFYFDVEEIYHETFAHAPIFANAAVPRKVLIMGGGDGLLLRELVKYPNIESITLVELDPHMVQLFRADPGLRRLNRDAFADPRVRLVFDDAYHFIRETEQFFDAVYLDFPAPEDFGLAKLYSREFYTFVRQRLTPGGWAALDAPGMLDASQATEGTIPADQLKSWQRYYQTLKAAGFTAVRSYASVLETENVDALNLMKDMMEAEGARELSPQVVKSELSALLESFNSGFVMASTTGWGSGPQGIPTVPLSFQNDVRLQMALAVQLPPAEGDPQRRAVNSVFRPVVPGFDEWWKIKTPY